MHAHGPHVFRASGCSRSLDRIVANDNGGRDLVEIVAWHTNAAGVLSDRFGIARLIDTPSTVGTVELIFTIFQKCSRWR
jgi:hypothetical protein